MAQKLLPMSKSKPHWHRRGLENLEQCPPPMMETSQPMRRSIRMEFLFQVLSVSLVEVLLHQDQKRELHNSAQIDRRHYRHLFSLCIRLRKWYAIHAWMPLN